MFFMYYSCSDCKTKSSNDSLNHSRSRINAYRALSSPSLIALSSEVNIKHIYYIFNICYLRNLLLKLKIFISHERFVIPTGDKLPTMNCMYIFKLLLCLAGCIVADPIYPYV